MSVGDYTVKKIDPVAEEVKELKKRIEMLERKVNNLDNRTSGLVRFGN